MNGVLGVVEIARLPLHCLDKNIVPVKGYKNAVFPLTIDLVLKTLVLLHSDFIFFECLWIVRIIRLELLNSVTSIQSLLIVVSNSQKNSTYLCRA